MEPGCSELQSYAAEHKFSIDPPIQSVALDEYDIIHLVVCVQCECDGIRI